MTTEHPLPPAGGHGCPLNLTAVVLCQYCPWNTPLLCCLTIQKDYLSGSHTYLLIYAHRSQWSIGHQRPPAIALCSGLLLSFQTSWSPAVSALLQCLASNCCEVGPSSSSPAGSRSGLGVWCWDAGFLRVCPIQPHLLAVSD